MESKDLSDFTKDLGINGSSELKGETIVSKDPLTDSLFLDSSKEQKPLTSSIEGNSNDLLDLGIKDNIDSINQLASKEMKSFLDNKTSEDPFKFEKPLPPEPIDLTADFLKSEIHYATDVDLIEKEKKSKVEEEIDLMFDKTEGREGSISPGPRDFDTPSPIPPPVPKHQDSREDSPLVKDDSPLPERHETPLPALKTPSPPLKSSPSPVPQDSPLHIRQESPSPEAPQKSPSPLPRESPSPVQRKSPSPVRQESPPPVQRDSPPIQNRQDTPPSEQKHQERDESPERYEPTQTPEPDFASFKPVADFDDDEKFVESMPAPSVKKQDQEKPKESQPPIIRKKSADDIGAKDIRVKIDAWFNPARLHPAVESLVYWRDPKKSGVVFGVVMLSLLSLTIYSLISVVAYLCLFTVLATISFRVYKSIMQAVQKTSDGHPFKEILDIDLTIPEDKVKEMSLCLVQYINTSLATLRSLFLVEDIIDSIKFTVILWVLTYVGACFNGLTLIIIGVVLLFTLPKVYENNKAQIDVYIKIAMDKLSVITNKVKTIVPESKKESDKPKDQ